MNDRHPYEPTGPAIGYLRRLVRGAWELLDRPTYANPDRACGTPSAMARLIVHWLDHAGHVHSHYNTQQLLTDRGLDAELQRAANQLAAGEHIMTSLRRLQRHIAAAKTAGANAEADGIPPHPRHHPETSAGFPYPSADASDQIATRSG